MTRFEEIVYNAVKRIPRGKVATYKVIARAIGKPRAVRAVGNALNKNRNPKVPCHRVTRSDSRVGGFAHGTQRKRNILRSEGVSISNCKVDDKCIIQKLGIRN